MIPEHLQEDFVTLEDGYVYFWAQNRQGALSSANLREIADELDKRNAPLDAEIEAFFAGGGNAPD